MSKKRPIVLLATTGSFLIVMCCGMSFVGAFILLNCGPMDYTVTATFEELPPDDKELEVWLKSQPGVYIGGWVVRNGNKIHALWGYVGGTRWDPVRPNLEEQFERFGY